MKLSKESMRLYAVTDSRWLNGKSLAGEVEQAIKGGVTFVQLREKELAYDAFVRLACEVKEVTDAYKVPFVINDNVEVALAVQADGVHVGQTDMAAGDVRSKIGPDKILGVSARTLQQAMTAQQNGADYLGVGAVYVTDTKDDASLTTMETIKQICTTVEIPVCVIGGLNYDNLDALKGTGIDGFALVSAIFAEKDVYKACKQLRAKIERIVG